MKTEGSENKKKISIVPTILWSIAGVLFLVYSIVVYKAGSGTNFFIFWIAAGIMCFIIEIIRRTGILKKIPGFLYVILTILVSSCIILFLLVEGFVISRFNSKGEPGLDYVIVLGAQYRTDGPSVVLKYRLDAAYDYLTENPETIAICSGGQGSNEPIAEGDGMKDYLVKRGIDENRIIVENNSTSTVENIKFSYALLDPVNDRIGILTNNFHVFRAVEIAKTQGGEHIVGIAADSNPVYLLNNMTREFAGVVKDIIKGNM